MCFIAGESSKHYACFVCRKVFRRRIDQQHFPSRTSHPCPDCSGEMVNAGPYFKAPKRRDREQWDKARLLAAHGFLFHPPSCCTYEGPGYRPALLREVPDFLAQQSAQQKQDIQS